MIATLLFFVISGAVMAVWSRFFARVPLRIALLLWVAVAVWQHDTLFTRKVDVPAGITAAIYPWKALGAPSVHANTGIAIQEMLPWTESGRRALRAGELPLWDRGRGAGGPLLGDLQNAIFHPFTLAGLFLPIGKAWTLSVSLRLFFALFFMFVLLRSWDLREEAALFGAIAYAFCTFNVVWLVISIGLSATMLPMALATTDELIRRPRVRSHAAAVVAYVLLFLSGHPETMFFVALATAAYGVFLVFVRRDFARVLLPASAALAGLLLTACVWYPAVAVIDQTDRYVLMAALRADPTEHHLSLEWLTPLVSPDILGTAPAATYRAPGPVPADLLNDYGEVCSAYAGLITLALAFAAIPLIRRSPLAGFGSGTAILALLTFAEAPGWFSFVRRLPLLDVALLQRWRFAWCLGVSILAAVALDALLAGRMSRRYFAAINAAVLALFAVVAASGLYALSARPAFEYAQIFAPAILLLFLLAMPRRLFAPIAIVAVFLDLMMVTWQYNPPSDPDHVLPMTPAIRAMAADAEPHRIVAMGSSFIPDTPGFYGLEDVKTTDPFARPEYLRFFRGYFDIRNDFNQVVHATAYPFTDFMNVKYIYAPPGGDPMRSDVREIYRGVDGSVYRNDRALPRYFFVRRMQLEPDFGNVVARAKQIADFRDLAFIDHVPPQVSAREPALLKNVLAGPVALTGGSVHVRRYDSNSAELEVVSSGWNLLVSSDAWWPGWRAWWGGQRLPVIRVNGAFVGVFVPPGSGRVRLRFRPAEFDTGLRAGVAALLLLAAGYAIAVKNGGSRNRGRGGRVVSGPGGASISEAQGVSAQ